MLKNCHSLLSTCHQLKLLHLFGDQETGQTNREGSDQKLREEIQVQTERVEKLSQ